LKHHKKDLDSRRGLKWGVGSVEKGYVQRWASFPPEVTVKSLPLPTNLKIVTVTSFSLPA
jgi:hypothetical protein